MYVSHHSYIFKVKSTANIPQKTLFKLAWTVKEQEDLVSEIRQLTVDMTIVKERLDDPQFDMVRENVASKLVSIRSQLAECVKKLSKHQRTPATHIFVFMISTETRQRKPYALPVQCLPIAALKDRQARELANKVISSMLERNMKVAGTQINHPLLQNNNVQSIQDSLLMVSSIVSDGKGIRGL